MATASGAKNTDVAPSPSRYAAVRRELELRPQEFQFFQAVRLLERFHPDRAPVGRFHGPAREVARFEAHASIVFPASQIQNLREQPSGPAAVVINFMGLTGPMGVLPLTYTTLILERLRAKDTALKSFLDIFNHRMVSLFYQAWEKYRFTIAYERGERDRFSHHLLDLIGLGGAGLQDRQALKDESLLFYSGLLSLHPRSAAALRQILEDYFEVPVEIDQFAGRWYTLDLETQCRFDKANTYSEQLGLGAIAGDEIWDQQSGVRLRVGPLSLAQYLDFLPNGSAHAPLRAITAFFSNAELDFEVQLILKRDEVPACELGDESAAAPQLGWSTWAKTVPLGYDPNDTILRI